MGNNTGGAFNFDRLGTGGYDSSGNNLSQTGDPFASFLLGQVQQASQTIPVYPTFNEAYTAAWVNDEFKVNDRLTLTLGLRFDYQFARTERDDQLDLRSEHAQPGSGEYSRRVDFRGKRPGPHREPEVPGVTGQGRLGPAGRVCLPAGRQERHPRRLRNLLLGSRIRPGRSVRRSASRPICWPRTCRTSLPRFYLDDGFPQDRVRFPPFIDPAFANGTAPLAVTPNGLTLPRWQNWSVTYQRQLSGNMMLGLSYIGNHGTRLPHHAQTLGVDANMNDPSVLALGATVLQSNINSAAAQAAGIRPPIPVSQEMWRRHCENTRNTRTSRGAACRWARVKPCPETVLERRFSRGLQARVAYTFSKFHNNGSENAQGSDGANAAVQNPADPLLSGPQCGRYAACVPGRLHLGSAWLRELVLGCRKGIPCGLERQWRAPIRERAAVQHSDGQRSRRLPFQWPETAEPGRRPTR